MARARFLALTGVVTLGVAGSVLPHPAMAVVSACATTARFDVNGDGFNDLAIGAPGEDVGSGKSKQRDAGMVTLVYGSGRGVSGGLVNGSQLLSQEDLGQTSETGDAFGSVLVTGDVNGDGCDDLVIGIPGENDGKGRAVVVFGSPTGLDPGSHQALDQDSPGVPGSGEAGDAFGTSLAVSGGAVAGLWVGSPGEDLGDALGAGTVARFPLSTDGSHLPTTGIESISQDSDGVPGSAESYDGFGEVLSGSATSLLVGVPHEAVGAHLSAGAFYAYDGHWTTWTQDSPGLAGGAEKGDRFGAAVTQLPCLGQVSEAYAVGAPGENLAKHADTGTVAVMGLAGTATLSQDSPGIPGGDEADDIFGRSLDGIDGVLAVGAPGENAGTGDVLQVALDCTAVPKVTLATSVSSWVVDDGDYFGSVVAFIDVTGDPLGPALVAGAPLDGETGLRDSGTVTGYSKRDPSGFLTTGITFIQQQRVSGLSEDDDHFGAALAGAS